MRLIDADALKRLVDEEEWFDCQEQSSFFTEIDKTPTIDPVKRGKWELHEYPDGYYHTECSECGAVYDEMVFFSKKAHYCPNCGARMDGGEGLDLLTQTNC